MAHSSIAVANELLQLANKAGFPLTQMQLQKLVYLAHGYYLADNGTPLVEDAVEAWEYGTVFPKLRDATKRYGKQAITRLIKWGDERLFYVGPKKNAIAALSPREGKIIKDVWKTYGHFPAFKLSALTHDTEGPWAEAYVEGENRVIPQESIRRYFKRLRAQNAQPRPA